MAGRKNEQRRVPIELGEALTGLEAGHHHARRCRCRLLDRAQIVAVVVGGADDDQLPSRVTQAREGADQIELPLLLDDPADAQDVAVRGYADIIEIGGSELRNAALHTIRNEACRDAVPGANRIDDALRDADARMCEPHSHPFAGAQDRLRHPSPFLAFVVEAVMRHHDAKTEHAGQRREKRRADRMDVDEIRLATSGGEQPQRGMQQRFDIFRTRRPDRRHRDALPDIRLR